MPTYYVGPGGNDGNSGLTWALRKLTLNGAEDVPVVAGDTVYVGPGTYRETLTCDVSGGVGSAITYIGDVTGQDTDDVGGAVRITGSDDDYSSTRNYCIYADDKDYRTFRGFTIDLATLYGIYGIDANNWIVEDSVFCNCENRSIYFSGTIDVFTLRRLRLLIGYDATDNIRFNRTGFGGTDSLIENCLIIGPYSGDGIDVDNLDGLVVKNSVVVSAYDALEVSGLIGGGGSTDVYNCIFTNNRQVFNAAVLGDIVEDRNTLYDNGTDRVNTNVGANSNTHCPLFDLGLLYEGVKIMPQPAWYELSEWSQVAAITGASESAEDLFGITKPVTAGKMSRGHIQFWNSIRDTGTTYGASAASLELPDAGRFQIRRQVGAVSTTVSVRVYREANYAGNLPQMIIKQPGQADRTTTDVGAAGAWNLLTDTWTPAATPPYIVIELVSRNTAGAGNYATYFDHLNA
ncbi:MAG: hypothetical protein PVJ86_09165 [Phycisphaerales bacterium]|jgi:hypothetical protein